MCEIYGRLWPGSRTVEPQVDSPSTAPLTAPLSFVSAHRMAQIIEAAHLCFVFYNLLLLLRRPLFLPAQLSNKTLLTTVDSLNDLQEQMGHAV